jgi:Na+/H+ antiporter NhaD/arsenite permease-like protein
MTWAAITGLVALMLLHRRDTRHVWENIDWSLLLFFAGLFIVVEGFIRSGAPAFFFAHYPLAGPHHGIADWMRTGGLFLLGSNVVSNVPFILVVKDQVAALPNPTLGWELLAVASTFAGNLTLLGSVANLIVAEGTREVGGIGFFEHLRIGLPLAVLTTVAGTLWLVVWHAG